MGVGTENAAALSGLRFAHLWLPYTAPPALRQPQWVRNGGSRIST
jgi:hypothetical protein